MCHPKRGSLDRPLSVSIVAGYCKPIRYQLRFAIYRPALKPLFYYSDPRDSRRRRRRRRYGRLSRWIGARDRKRQFARNYPPTIAVPPV